MSQCKAYKQRTDIHPDTYVGTIPVNCGNCQLWDGERCEIETLAVSENDPGNR